MSSSFRDFCKFKIIHKIKQYFIDICPVSNKYESGKIWAHWIIRQQSLMGQDDEFIPTRIKEARTDREIIKHLTDKDITDSDAVRFYEQFLDYLQSMYFQTYHPICYEIEMIVNKSVTNGQVHIEIGGNTQSIDLPLYQNLSIRSLNPDQTDYQIWKVMNNYTLLDNSGLQWSLPPKIFSFLKATLNINHELFASPLNCYLDNYYSLFDSDRFFQSKGNFFDADPEEYSEGFYEINPPFIEDLFIESSRRILSALTIATQREKPLFFIYIMPNWLDSKGYQCLKKSPFLTEEIVVKRFQHYYYDYATDQYIKANFDTHILILNNLYANIWLYEYRYKIFSMFKK